MTLPLLVTIATQRSGTKFLGAALNGGTLLRSFGEPFKPPPPDGPFPAFAAGWIADHPGFAFRGVEYAALLNDFLDTLQARARAQGRGAHLDVMYNTLGAFSGIWSWPVRPRGDSTLLRVLQSRGAAFIHLVRESLAECVASTVVAERRGYHRTTELSDQDQALRLRANPKAARAAMEGILETRAFLRRAFRTHERYIELRYPDFIAEDGLAPPALAQVAALLGIDGGRAADIAGRSALRPTAPDKAQVIENWDELVAIEAALRATRPMDAINPRRGPAYRPSRPCPPC